VWTELDRRLPLQSGGGTLVRQIRIDDDILHPDALATGRIDSSGGV